MIKVKNPIVELDGDEMTRVMWKMIKDKLILPHLDVDLKYFDLGIESRDKTDDQITVDAASAIKEFGVGVKCATITATDDRVKEYNLKEVWKSPNGTIRTILGGTVFRAPIVINNIPPYVRTWKKPITIARHAYGDIYKNVELNVPAGGKAELVVTTENSETRETIHEFTGQGVIQGIHNTDKSIEAFAVACFNFAVQNNLDVWFSAKDTISKTYHTRFKQIFDEVASRRKAELDTYGIEYYYTLIDDAVARVMRDEGGFLWALMNYDGDVMSDMIASGFGSLGLMTSVLQSPEGAFEYEAAHGTVQRHYYKHLKGEATSTNSTASIFAWTGAIRKRGELDETPNVIEFADKLEKAVIDAIESGTMTGDLARITSSDNPTTASTEEFLDAIAAKL